MHPCVQQAKKEKLLSNQRSYFKLASARDFCVDLRAGAQLFFTIQQFQPRKYFDLNYWMTQMTQWNDNPRD